MDFRGAEVPLPVPASLPFPDPLDTGKGVRERVRRPSGTSRSPMVGVGVIDGKNTRVESAQLIAHRTIRAGRQVIPQRPCPGITST